ncbi:SusC/RagA family TonB-linked outer membrane protein [Ferruginibacter sp.]|nr:TonB-dependent receptor [Ferruginibacter sp.]
MTKLLSFLLLLFIVPLSLLAQNKTIKGKVTDETGVPIAGVTVITKGAKKGTQTDKEGNFSVSVTGSGSIDLVLSSVGYTSKIVKVTGTDAGTVQLIKEAITQEDVVVVGYATVRRKDLTGTVSSVSAKQIKDIPLSSAAEALQGRLAGVQAIATEGAPGADILIRVRGGGSITQDNSPMYIVDGVQVENALSVIAPQDIASIDVLKDASTTAIYGARAANGVVIITTKVGRPGKTQVAYNGGFGVRQLPKIMDVLSPYDFVVWQWERSRGAADSAAYGSTWDTLANYKNVAPINWQDEVFGRNAKFQNHNISVNGGNQATTFNLSVTANREDGIQLESGFDRNLLNFKLDHKVSDKVKVGITARYLDQTVKGIGTTNSGTRTTNRLRHSITYRPFELPTATGGIDDFDEAYFLASAGQTNPIILAQSEYRRQFTKGTYLSGYFNYNILKNLVFRSTVGFDNVNTEQRLFFSKITSTARNAASLPVASIGNQYNRQLTNSNTLQYSVNNLKNKHDFSVLVGQEIIDQRVSNTLFQTNYFPADISAEKALANMGLGAAPTGSSQPLPFSFVNPPSRIASFFGRVNYGYDDRYLATFNLRSDRSTKFAPSNGSLVFPSGSLAWRFSKEKFAENLKWLNDGKIRLGLGAVGNNRIGNLLFMQLYGVTGQYAINHSILPGFAPTALANPNLRWEQSNTRNFGLDLSVLDNKIQFTVDIYKNTAKDLLLDVAIPPTTGYTSQIQNIGSTSNRGVEFQINATPVSNKNFTWSSNFNISFNKNRVEGLGGVSELQRNSGWQGSDGIADYLVKVGQPVGQMYGFVTDGFYKIEDFNYSGGVYTLKAGVPSITINGNPQPGVLKWKDIGGPNGVPDGVISADYDRTVIGDANPKFTGGWNNQFSYKNFDMSVFVNFVVGNDVYNANKVEWTDGSFSNINMLNIMKDRWTNIDATGQRVTDPVQLAALNANAKIWTPVRSQRWWLHSWAIEDGSYLRFNNLTVGYTLPKAITAKAKISSFRVYATVNNLGTITNYTGYDPDVTARRSDPLTPGVDFAAYPRSRTWVFGLNVTF